MARDLTELTRIIRRIEAKARTSNSLASPAARPTIEALLDGSVEETERGRLLVVRRRFPVGHRHGAQPLLAAREAMPAALALLSRGGPGVTDGRRLLYLDTETTGLAGGTGTYAFLVGLGFFDGDDFEVRQFFMRDLDEEPALLSVLEEMFERFDGFVTYNGAGFDLPLLETRFVLGRRRFPGEAFHVDLLGPARRLWSGRLADCRLGTVEQDVLGFLREDDLPGALIPTVYFEYLRRKRPDQLPRVFEHNRHDILSLVALTGWVADAVVRAPRPEFDPEALAGLGRMLEGAEPERSLACYRMALDTGLPTPLRERLLLRLALREKRLARWEEARALWEAAARSPREFDPRPWEEIAKVHEHRRRDLMAAREVVEQALALARRHRASERVLAGFEHRLARLGRRLERVAGLGDARQPA
ncbi:MAG: ribonuclease H-like domain-containing protein [Candidatus Rokuibacteriota bacterium]